MTRAEQDLRFYLMKRARSLRQETGKKNLISLHKMTTDDLKRYVEYLNECKENG